MTALFALILFKITITTGMHMCMLVKRILKVYYIHMLRKYNQTNDHSCLPFTLMFQNIKYQHHYPLSGQHSVFSASNFKIILTFPHITCLL